MQLAIWRPIQNHLDRYPKRGDTYLQSQQMFSASYAQQFPAKGSRKESPARIDWFGATGMLPLTKHFVADSTVNAALLSLKPRVFTVPVLYNRILYLSVPFWRFFQLSAPKNCTRSTICVHHIVCFCSSGFHLPGLSFTLAGIRPAACRSRLLLSHPARQQLCNLPLQAVGLNADAVYLTLPLPGPPDLWLGEAASAESTVINC